MKQLPQNRLGSPSSRHGGVANALLKTFGFLLIAGLIIGIFYGLTLLGPRKVDPAELESYNPNNPATEKLRQSIKRLVAQFDDIENIRKVKEEDIGILRAALQQQKELLDLTFNSDLDDIEYLKVLSSRFDNIMGKMIFAKSQEAEAMGNKEMAAGNLEAALPHLQRALHLQNKIHEKHPLSDFKNKKRQIILDSSIHDIKAKPYFVESEKMEQLAIREMDDGDLDKAYEYLTAAIQNQKVINEKHRNSRYANVRRLESLQNEHMSIRSGRTFLSIQGLIYKAEEAEIAGQHTEAADYYQDAETLQRKLNESYPESRYASADQVEQLEIMRQTAVSKSLADEIARKDKDLNKLLSQQKLIRSATKVADLAKDLKWLHQVFPKSKYLDPDLQRKITYLTYIQPDISFIQDSVLRQLVPLSTEDWVMYKTEVSQILYEKIMGENPSRTKDHNLPVDSVSWDNAVSFCEKLGWVLGRSVLLPSKEQFTDAVGDIRYAPILEWAWCIENSKNKTHPVGTKSQNRVGFFDMLGNVSEWVRSEEVNDNKMAYLAGGSANTSAESLTKIPFVLSDKNERSRFTGIRFVVRALAIEK